MRTELIDRYAWACDFEALTVAVIHGRTADDVLRSYGADPDRPLGDFPFAQADDVRQLGNDGGESNLMILHTEAAPAVIALENNGYSGAVPEIARRCSAGGGRFFSVYWNVNAFGTVIEAIDGTVTAYFEYLHPIAPKVALGEKRPSWAIGEKLDVSVAEAACFALMEQRTGVALDRYWLNEPRPVYAIPDPHWMLKGIEGVDRP